MIENLNKSELRSLIKKATLRLEELESQSISKSDISLVAGEVYVSVDGDEIEIVNQKNNIFYGKNRKTKITKEYYINGKQSRHKNFNDDIKRKK